MAVMRLILRRFVASHHPMLCWFSASTAAAMIATVTDQLSGDEVFSAFFIAAPLIAMAWLAAAAAEFAHAMRTSCNIREMVAAIAGTLALGIAGPFLMTGVNAATDGIITLLFASHLIS
jgi:hypothetical protein